MGQDCRARRVRRKNTRRGHRATRAMMRPHTLIGSAIAAGDPLPPEDRYEQDRGEPGRASLLGMLYRTHRNRLLRFVRRKGRGEDAEDIVQQAYCRVAGLGQGNLDMIDTPEAYLLKASENLVRDAARARARHAADQHVSDDDVPLQGHDQIAALEARDALRRIEAALARLKPRTREIFLAHRIDGYSYAEIATRTGLSIKTVEMHMTRAITYLHRQRMGQ
ncbi:MAG: sigma-70 family RNA polymerase sigma factor [Candidatus Sphingomonas phytovorans]|nr:sigma-70 family RNA polymerase sigma factor [Sphingomonas sp.]WEK02192.1 MAG: sigma-70 family RNA polymerase sigma factor [Sphingomonas sp.]